MNEGEMVDQEVIEAAGPSLKVVVACSAGYDHIDVKAMHKAGIRVGHSPNVLDQGVAEHTMTLILMSLYRVQEHIA